MSLPLAMSHMQITVDIVISRRGSRRGLKPGLKLAGYDSHQRACRGKNRRHLRINRLNREASS
jgi:hypothetical protein